MKFLLILLTSIIFIYSSFASTLHGKIEPNTVITIYQYTDYIVYNKIPIAETTTDATGKFSINISIGELERLSINIGDDILRLYASNDINYTLSKKNSECSISTDDNKENINDKLKYALADWNTVYDMWVKDRRFVAIDKPERILRKLDTIKSNIITDRYRACYEYSLAGKSMYYIVYSYVKSDSVEAHRLFNKLIEDMLVNKPVAANSPFYISFLENYVRYRMNATKFLRVRKKEPVYNRLVREANSFSNDSLKALIQVLGMNIIYGHTWYDSISTANERAVELKNKMTIPVYKRYMDLVIKHHNKVGVGDAFPIVLLNDNENKAYSIDQVTTPYILIDFWATWCSPCKRGMKKFPELKDKYKGQLEIVAISTDTEMKSMVDYLSNKHYIDKWVNLHNGDKGGYHDVVPISSYPTYYILDSNKKVVAIPKSPELVTTIEQLMK